MEEATRLETAKADLEKIKKAKSGKYSDQIVLGTFKEALVEFSHFDKKQERLMASDAINLMQEIVLARHSKYLAKKSVPLFVLASGYLIGKSEDEDLADQLKETVQAIRQRYELS